MERQLLADYEADVELMLSHLTPETLASAIELAQCARADSRLWSRQGGVGAAGTHQTGGPARATAGRGRRPRAHPERYPVQFDPPSLRRKPLALVQSPRRAGRSPATDAGPTSPTRLQLAAMLAVLSLAWPYYGIRNEDLPWPQTAFAIGASLRCSPASAASPGGGE
jgi:hypothetical protein